MSLSSSSSITSQSSRNAIYTPVSHRKVTYGRKQPTLKSFEKWYLEDAFFESDYFEDLDIAKIDLTSDEWKSFVIKHYYDVERRIKKTHKSLSDHEKESLIVKTLKENKISMRNEEEKHRRNNVYLLEKNAAKKALFRRQLQSELNGIHDEFEQCEDEKMEKAKKRYEKVKSVYQSHLEKYMKKKKRFDTTQNRLERSQQHDNDLNSEIISKLECDEIYPIFSKFFEQLLPYFNKNKYKFVDFSKLESAYKREFMEAMILIYHEPFLSEDEKISDLEYFYLNGQSIWDVKKEVSENKAVKKEVSDNDDSDNDDSDSDEKPKHLSKAKICDQVWNSLDYDDRQMKRKGKKSLLIPPNPCTRSYWMNENKETIFVINNDLVYDSMNSLMKSIPIIGEKRREIHSLIQGCFFELVHAVSNKYVGKHLPRSLPTSLVEIIVEYYDFDEDKNGKKIKDMVDQLAIKYKLAAYTSRLELKDVSTEVYGDNKEENSDIENEEESDDESDDDKDELNRSDDEDIPRRKTKNRKPYNSSDDEEEKPTRKGKKIIDSDEKENIVEIVQYDLQQNLYRIKGDTTKGGGNFADIILQLIREDYIAIGTLHGTVVRNSMTDHCLEYMNDCDITVKKGTEIELEDGSSYLFGVDEDD